MRCIETSLISCCVFYLCISASIIFVSSDIVPSVAPTPIIVCPSGEGYDGTECTSCPIGYWNDGTSLDCYTCTNKPSRSYYTTSGSKNGDCAYKCNAGLTGLTCYTPVQSFIYNMVTLSGVVIIVFCLVCGGTVPRMYMKRGEKLGWWKKVHSDVDTVKTETLNAII